MPRRSAGRMIKARMSRARGKAEPIGPLDSALGVLFLASFPIFRLLFEGSGVAAFRAFLLLVLLLVALRLIHVGHQVRKAFTRAPAARAPKLPCKTLGHALIGLMVTLLAGHHFETLVLPVTLGALAAALGIVAFGMDPLGGKADVEAADQPERPVDLHHLQPGTSETLIHIDAKLEELAGEVAGLGDAEITRQFEALRTGVMALSPGAGR